MRAKLPTAARSKPLQARSRNDTREHGEKKEWLDRVSRMRQREAEEGFAFHGTRYRVIERRIVTARNKEGVAFSYTVVEVE